MSTLTTGVQYPSFNDASYEDPSIDSAPIKNGFHVGKRPFASISNSLPGLIPGNKEGIYSGLSPIFPTNISDFLQGNGTPVEGGGGGAAAQCGENFVDNMECFMILTPGQQLAIAILALTLGTFTVLENLMVLCVILHSQTLRSRPSYHFIGSLAVADLIGSIIFVYSFLDFHILHRKDSPSIFLFKLAGVIASFTASVGSLFLTAIDRYISIHRPMAYKHIVTKTKAVIAFSLMWTISIVISLLPLLGWNCKRLNSVCSDIFPLIDQKYLMFWIGMTSILVLFIIYAYMFILWKSHHHSVRMLSRSSQRSVIVYTAEGTKVQTVRPEQARMDLRLAKTLVLILVALIICWGPLLAIMVYDLFGKVNDFIKTVFAFCSMLCLLNSTVNPVIYAMRSKDLRRAFLNICHMYPGATQPLDNSAESDWNSRSVRGTAGGAGKDGSGCGKTQLKLAQTEFPLQVMACGATLKRTMDFDPLMSPASPKRRRCIPVPSASSSSPRKYFSMEPSPFGESSSRLSAEQILNNIKQEYKRVQKRKHLDGGYQHSECCYSPESPSQSSTMNVSGMPGTSCGGISPTRKEQPLFTLRQVGMICERLLKEREEKVREEYEETMTSKLAEQYDTFIKFTHDQLMRRFGEQPASYVS
ncbi:hypothetical protein Q5P01_020201 [Channa striata]|uniref:G-protein coupled receptors family 1 profile domain-containing protein n=1 Tax=Channa striata TaxID=64152 RepID=A0AA88LWZ9_CHASR|nr:hypothetical protein Q5P01_020201 [Channa striata]